ncbi:MAG: cell division protein SepF [bacterium]|nr:cell division protein SepF [bacterium]
MWKRLKEYIMIPESENDDIVAIEEEEVDAGTGNVLPFGLGKNREQRKQTSPPKRIQVCKPYQVEEVTEIIDHLLQGDGVMFNLEKIEHKNKQRVIDMITGYCYSKDQRLKQVNEDIYFVCE